MSKIIATKAIRGAHALVERAEKELAQAVEEKDFLGRRKGHR